VGESNRKRERVLETIRTHLAEARSGLAGVRTRPSPKLVFFASKGKVQVGHWTNFGALVLEIHEPLGDVYGVSWSLDQLWSTRSQNP